MSTGENVEQLSIRRMAWRGIRKYFDAITTVAIVTAALRIAAVLPLFLSVDLGGRLPTWMSVVAALTVYVLGPIPMRFWGREKMRRMFYSRHMNHRKNNLYEKWLGTGLIRYLRGMLWGIPFLACIAYFAVFVRILDAKTFWMPVRSLAVVVGQEPNITTGLLVTLGLMALLGLLFAYGWWRDLPVEYLPVRCLGTVKTLHWSRRIRKRHRGAMWKNLIVNIFLSLPFWIGLVAVLAPHVKSSVDFSLSADMVLAQVTRLFKEPLPTKTLLMIGGTVLFLYVPFWIFRKTRNAALMGTLIRENSHTSHSSTKKTPPPQQEQTYKKVDFHPSMKESEKLDARPILQAGEEAGLERDAARLAQEADRDDHAAG